MNKTILSTLLAAAFSAAFANDTSMIAARPAPAPAPLPAPAPPPASPYTVIPSGQVPDRCLPFKQSKQMQPLLNCYLNDTGNSLIAGRIVWTFGSQHLAWKQWPDSARTELALAAQRTLAWYDSGMQNYPGPLVPDPAVNIYANDVMNGVHGLTIVDHDTTVWPTYIGHIALMLTSEIYGWVPYSIKSYPEYGDLAPLFESGFAYFSLLQNGVPQTMGYGPVDAIVPTNAITVFKFLKQNGLIGNTPAETIERVLNWGRWNLWHIYGPFDSPNMYEYFQYWGKAPMSRILQGTVTQDPVGLNESKGEAKHWTAGCHGTTAFLKWVLRAANVPVNTAGAAAHQMPYFVAEKRYLTHADDIYTDFARSKRPVSSFLIDAATFQAWLPQNDPVKAESNMGRNVLEDNISYPSPLLVNLYQLDWQEGLSHANGRVFQVYKNWYSVQQLEQKGLWIKLDQLLYQQM